MEKEYYVYCYMDPRKPGKYTYDGLDICFLWEPFYIGKGKGDRIKKHIMSHELFNQKRVNHNKIKNFKMKSIIDSGLNPFYIKLYTNLDNKKSSDIEIELITKIGRVIKKNGPLTNISDGGEGGDNMKYMDPVKKRELYDRLSKMFKGQPYKGPDRGKKIYQYDLDGNFIKDWPSIRNASSELNIHKYTISQSLNDDKYKSAGGYMFRSYKLDKINPLIKKVVSVIQCDLQGNVIKEWDSMQIAAKTLNLSISGISLCCSGKYKSCGGFTWRYNK